MDSSETSILNSLGTTDAREWPNQLLHLPEVYKRPDDIVEGVVDIIVSYVGPYETKLIARIIQSQLKEKRRVLNYLVGFAVLKHICIVPSVVLTRKTS